VGNTALNSAFISKKIWMIQRNDVCFAKIGVGSSTISSIY